MVAIAEDLPLPPRRFSLPTAIRRNPTITFGAVLLFLLIAVAIVGPSFVGDPFKIAPVNRLRPPSERWWFGTDQFGRDVFTRTIYGARVSLIVGLSVAAISSVLGLALGLACGYFRRIDGIVMRIMDGVMAIPSILLAIALITLTRPGLGIVIVAIVIPEVPRIVRVVRAVVLSIRAQPYIESAIAGGTQERQAAVAPRRAQHAGAADRAGDLCLRLGDADRGGPALPRRRRAARSAELGQHHRPGPHLLPDRAVDDPDPRRLPRRSPCWR